MMIMMSHKCTLFPLSPRSESDSSWRCWQQKRPGSLSLHDNDEWAKAEESGCAYWKDCSSRWGWDGSRLQLFILPFCLCSGVPLRHDDINELVSTIENIRFLQCLFARLLDQIGFIVVMSLSFHMDTGRSSSAEASWISLEATEPWSCTTTLIFGSSSHFRLIVGWTSICGGEKGWIAAIQNDFSDSYTLLSHLISIHRWRWRPEQYQRWRG